MIFATLVGIVLAQVPSTTLSGTVVGPGGDPVVGAEVILVGLPSYDPPIVARVKSGEGGRFSLDRPTALAGDHHPQRAPILWVVKPGFRASTTRFPEALPKADQPVRVVLEPPGKAEVRVNGPDDHPEAGAKVLMERLRSNFTIVPDVVAELTAATTNADGLAVLDAVTHEELAYLDVHSKRFGIQGRTLGPSAEKPRRIALRAVSTVKGRLTGSDPKFVRGWRIRAWSRIYNTDPKSKAEPETTGYVETKTDDEGRFTLAPIAVGSLQLDLRPPGELPVAADIPSGLSVPEGREGSVEIPLRETATITGLVLERGTGKPVPGVQAWLNYLGANRNGSLREKTDAQGRYTFKALPGKARLNFNTFPKSHVAAPVEQTWFDFTVPAGPKVIEMAKREALSAAPPLHGRIVDEAGRPVPGASYQAQWSFAIGGHSSGGSYNSSADENGEFVLEGLGPGSNISITARSKNRRNDTPVKARAGQESPVTIAIVPMPTVAVAGRLIGPGGTPMAGVPVKIQFRIRQNNFPGFPQEARFEGNPTFVTGPDGTFRTPRELDRKPSEYRVEVDADGFLTARTAWVSMGDSDVVTLPDLTLKRSRGVRVVSGQVVDREGKPVAEATVIQAGDGPKWTKTKGDASGRFRLPGVAGGEALVFAEAPGFRFGGAIVEARAKDVVVRLARVTEPPLSIPGTLRAPLTRTEERALGRRTLAPLLPKAWAGTLGITNRSVLPALARIDPARILTLAENRAIDPTGLVSVAALGQFEDDPAAASATIEADLDPGARADGWLALETFRPRSDRATCEMFLDRALLDKRRAGDPEEKIRRLGLIADRWLELGSIERATPILREGQALIANLPRSSWSFQNEDFANVLAVIDLPAARDLFTRKGWTNVSPADIATIKRHEAEAACRLAAIDPAEAERLLPPPSAPNLYDRTGFVLRVARRMAKVDPARARKILETLTVPTVIDRTRNSALAVFGLGLMAEALASTNPDQARKLLDESFAGLRQIAINGPLAAGANYNSISLRMAQLLPITERLEPDRLAERIWLTAASRAPLAPEPQAREVQETVVLAMLLARYDREAARTIIAPTLERLPDLIVASGSSYNNSVAAPYRALAAYDPQAVLALIRALPDSARKPPPKHDTWTAATVEDHLRLAVAEMLGFPAEVRAREALRSANYAWPPLRGD